MRARRANAWVAIACVAAAIVPAAAIAFPGHRSVEAARAEAASEDDGSDAAERLLAIRLESELLARDVVPSLVGIGDALAHAAPLFDADGDRALEVIKAAASAGATLVEVRPDASGRTERGGYRFHAVETEAEGNTTQLFELLRNLETGPRRAVVLWARFERGTSAAPTTRLKTRLLFSERTTAPDPHRVGAILKGMNK